MQHFVLGPIGMNAHILLQDRMSSGLEYDFQIPQFNYIFKSTYSLMLYQEQIMKLTEDMCGFNSIESMAFIKTVAKKDRNMYNSFMCNSIKE